MNTEMIMCTNCVALTTEYRINKTVSTRLNSGNFYLCKPLCMDDPKFEI